jgi:hypothetical protein
MIRVRLPVDHVNFSSPHSPLHLLIRRITFPLPEDFSSVKNSRFLRLTTRIYLVQRLRMRGAVLTQFHISSCLVNKSPMKILVWKPYYIHTEFQFSASPVNKNKLFHSINVTMTDRDVIRRRQTVGILTRMTCIVPECFGIV